MSKFATLFWCMSILAAGTFLFQIKYDVIQLEDELDHIKRQIVQDRQTIHLLKAEWGHLTDPTRLSRLSEQYLKFIPANPTQMASMRGLPMVFSTYLAKLPALPVAGVSNFNSSADRNAPTPLQPVHFQSTISQPLISHR